MIWLAASRFKLPEAQGQKVTGSSKTAPFRRRGSIFTNSIPKRTQSLRGGQLSRSSGIEKHARSYLTIQRRYSGSSIASDLGQICARKNMRLKSTCFWRKFTMDWQMRSIGQERRSDRTNMRPLSTPFMLRCRTWKIA